MGNRPTIEQRKAAGTDAESYDSDGSRPPNTTPTSSDAASSFDGSYTESRKEAQKAVAEHNAAALRKEYNRIEEGWDSEYSTISRSEMTTTDQSKLPSPLTDQSTPFRIPRKEALSNAGGAQTTTTTGAAESSAPSPTSLSSSDTWYGLPSLIETVERSELEAFAQPSASDKEWVAQAHAYFDNEKIFVRKSQKPCVGRRLRIGRIQKRRWSTIIREMALRHPLPVNPAPFPLSKAMDELKLRPEKRFTMPHN